MSLTSGTFVLLVRLFFFLAARVPLAGLRKENSKMKINYTFADGETSEVEVTEEIGNMILDSRRQESNLDRKERYHCYSSDAAEFEGEEYADADTPESLLERKMESRQIADILAGMPEIQRRRLLLYAEGKSLREIARIEGVDHKAIKKSIEAARKYFRKKFGTGSPIGL